VVTPASWKAAFAGAAYHGRMTAHPCRRSSRALPALLAAVVCLSCHESRTGRFESKSIPDRERRLEVIGRYLNPVTPIDDAGFVIDYHDNGGGLLPGPSDWTMLVALRVAPGQAATWAATYGRELGHPTEDPDLRWGLELVKERGWSPPRGRPEVFAALHGLRAVYPEDGIVLIRDEAR
jgi:hypothetical protein